MINRRTDEFGRAFAGSQLQIQTYVNRRQAELDSAIRSAFPALANAELEWVSPLESEGFVEYQDESFLGAIGHPQIGTLLSSFWPNGGPRWDALARVRLSSSPQGVLLIEAKSYPAEMYSDGCRAVGSSRRLIADSLSQARDWCGADITTDWMGPLYQFANRLAHLYFLRELAGIPAWLANVCFIGDPHKPTPGSVWQEALTLARSTLGLAEGSGANFADVLVPAVGRELFQQPPERRRETAPAAARSKPRSLLSGVDDLIDRALGVLTIGQSAPHYRHLTSYRHVAGPRQVDGIGMIGGAYTLIEQNWPGTRCRSKENWRWEKQLHISNQNGSPEKRFEKAVAKNCPEWFNMIPVASGVMPETEEGGRRIDLARECEPGWFEFVELKFGPKCDTPLRAAIEILEYGLIYVFSRVHAGALRYDAGNPLLSAQRISLRAVLPGKAYSSGSLAELELSLNAGLHALTARLGVPCQIDFAFESLPANASLSDPCAAMRGRTAVYSPLP